MDYATYLKEGIKVVKKLLSKGDLQSAKLGCEELLKSDPYNPDLQKLQQKIEKEILDVNLEKVKKEIKRTWNLWNDKRYDELLQIYNRLYEYAPQYERLAELIQKVEEAMSDKDRKNRRQFITDAIQTIKKVFEKKRYGETIQACQELLIIDPRNPDAKNILQNAREAMVEEKLKENERIVDSGDYERALELYESLLAVDSKSAKLLGLIRDAERHVKEKRELVHRIQINEGVKRIKDLFETREYEKVLQACEEVLQRDQENFTAHLFLKKAEDVINQEIEASVQKKLQANLPALHAEYAKNKDEFIKI